MRVQPRLLHVAIYERSVRVEAPLGEVWDFYSRAEGLVRLTPDWLALRIESVRGPDGETDSRVLETGSRIRVSAEPLGCGPRESWTSEIIERERGEDFALFRDTMHGGPFEHWEHTHRFVADDGETIVHDHVEYELPCGSVGRAIAPFGAVGFEPMFRHRHRRTKELLEDGETGPNGG